MSEPASGLSLSDISTVGFGESSTDTRLVLDRIHASLHGSAVSCAYSVRALHDVLEVALCPLIRFPSLASVVSRAYLEFLVDRLRLLLPISAVLRA